MDMRNKFSSVASKLWASEIRELLKLTSKKDIISFAGGLPNPEAFPYEEVKQLCSEVLENYGRTALQYGPSAGLALYREAVVDYLRRSGIEAKEEEIIALTGSQLGLYMVARLFVNPGESIVVEVPTYLGAIQAFSANEARFFMIPIDDEGMRTDVLEERLKKAKAEGKMPKFIYTVPNFHNPAGVTMSLERRKHLLEIASEFDLPVLEDDPYGHLRYVGEPLPSLKKLDQEGRVLYLGSFSKVFSPGLRVAFIAAPEPANVKLEIMRQGIDLCPNSLSQILVALFIKNGMIWQHIPRIRKIYGRKRKIMLDSLEDYFPKEVRWSRPEGGMFVWVSLPEKVDTEKMFPKALKRKVAYVHGAAFYPDRSKKNEMRLNFTAPPDEMIKEGVRRLAEVVREELAS